MRQTIRVPAVRVRPAPPFSAVRVAVFAALPLAAAFCAAQSLESPYDRATALFREGKAADAESALRQFVQADSKDARAWNLLGVVLDSRRQYSEAEQCFRKAALLAPGSPGVLNNLGNHYLAAGKPELAIAEFRKVVAIAPAHGNANLQLARLSVEHQEPKAALQYLSRLKGKDAEGLDVQLVRARALHLAGRNADALAAFAAAANRAVTASEWYSIGIAEAAAGEFQSAEQSLSRALQGDPANSDILHDLGLAAMRAGHTARAQQVFETMARARPDDPEALFQLGRAVAAQGRDDDAILVLAQARKLAPSRPDIVHMLAGTTMKAGFFGDAALAFGEYLKLRPEDETARRERGFAYACAGKTADALRDLEWYAAKHPKDPQGLFELGVAMAARDVNKAVANLNEAVRLKPDFAEAYFVRGQVLSREGRSAEAARDLEQAVSRRPDHIRAIAALGRAYLDLERPQDAVRVLRQGYEKFPRDPQILITLGRALTRSGDRAEAARIFQEFSKVRPDRSAERAAPGVLDLLNLPADDFDRRYEANLRAGLVARRDDPEVRSRLARFLLTRGRNDEALAEYRILLESRPPASVSLACGRDLIGTGQFALAKQFIAPIAEAEGADARLDLAIALIGNSEPAAAIRELDHAPLTERLGDYYLVRAQAFDAMGQVGPASDSLGKALDKAPTRADLYVQAAYFLLRHGRDADAVALLDHGAKRIPDDGPLLLLRAALLGAQNRSSEALALLQRITARWPEWGRPYLVRAIIEESSADSQNALKSAEAAIAMGEHTAEAYYYLAQAIYHATPENARGAVDAIRKSLELNSADPWALALAGRLTWELGEFSDSEKYLQQAIRLKKDFARAHFWLGATYKSMGRTDDANRELAEVASIHERNPRAESEELEGGRNGLFGIRP